VAEIDPEGDAQFGAGFDQAEEGIVAVAPDITAWCGDCQR
jgi:hypothetical protein